MKYDNLNKPNIHKKYGLFTDRGCWSGKEVTHEAVVNYREWVTTMPM